MSTAGPPTELITDAAGVEHLDVRAAQLRVVKGPDCGLERRLSDGVLLVGTDPSCDLVLADSSVSRRQLELRATAQGFVLRDLASTNGTFIDRVRVREVLLTDKTRIRVGRDELVFEPLGERERLELSRHERFGKLLGRSPAMRRCFALLEQAARSDVTVVLEGESGTGKDLAAESLHAASARADGPFVVVDCGAVAPSLIESELFGHEKGAFTDASTRRIGALESAHRGTLFLDEIGELDLALQPKLLRFLERREVRRVGSSSVTPVDVRFVAATNRRLDQMVAQGRFREDLFYRLAVVRVQMPPLRARPEDISLIALELGRAVDGRRDPNAWLDAGTLEVLQSHAWPGNVRELRNVVERIAALPEIGVPELLGAPDGDTQAAPDVTSLPYHEAKRRTLEAFERRYLQALLQAEGDVVARAAERAEVPRQTLFRLLRKHGLREE